MIKELEVGTQLDHYRIESCVATSGMSSIYRATDERDERVVAIKVPHPEMECDSVLFERFRREQHIGQTLDHPGVMKVLESEKYSRVYMVMEWVEGKLLRKILQETPKLPVERAVKLTVRVLEALEYCHAHGVVHRDMKPENVMVDPEDQIKLIDFGIAGDAAARRLTYANFSQTLGTPDYISPEQVKGKRGDARSDVFSMGVMLYEMVTGTTPYTGVNAFVVMNDRLLNSPKPPREIDPEISPVLQEIIYRALEKEPQNRYATAREFAFDLEHPDKVTVQDRAEMKNWHKKKSAWPGKLLKYGLLALIPIVILGLMFLVAKR